MSAASPQAVQPPAAGPQQAQDQPAARPPLYRSKHPPTAPVPCSLLGVKQIRNKGTMGPGSGEELVNTSKWIKAHEHEPELPQRECAVGRLAGVGPRLNGHSHAAARGCSLRFLALAALGPPNTQSTRTWDRACHAAAKRPPKERRKAPLPARDDVPLMGLSSGKDFVLSNVAEAVQVEPKYQEHEEVGAGDALCPPGQLVAELKELVISSFLSMCAYAYPCT